MVVAEMKFRFAVTITLFASLLIFANTNVAQAGWSSINSGYAVTTNVHGQEVLPDHLMTAWAGTTDGAVKTVEFVWKDPDENVVEAWHEVVDLSDDPSNPYTTDDVPSGAPQEIVDWALANPGVTIWYAQCSTHNPEDWTGTVIGDWTVQVFFHDTGTIQGQDSDIVAIRASSFFVIDEVPLGTIVVLLIPFGFLGIYAIKRKRSISIQTA